MQELFHDAIVRGEHETRHGYAGHLQRRHERPAEDVHAEAVPVEDARVAAIQKVGHGLDDDEHLGLRHGAKIVHHNGQPRTARDEIRLGVQRVVQPRTDERH